jgi:hypothetical protein
MRIFADSFKYVATERRGKNIYSSTNRSYGTKNLLLLASPPTALFFQKK